MSSFLGFTLNGGIGKDWFWEIQLFSFIRSFKDGITFFEFKLNWDRYEDEHKPAFQIELTVFNCYNHFWIYNNKQLDNLNNQ